VLSSDFDKKRLLTCYLCQQPQPSRLAKAFYFVLQAHRADIVPVCMRDVRVDGTRGQGTATIRDGRLCGWITKKCIMTREHEKIFDIGAILSSVVK